MNHHDRRQQPLPCLPSRSNRCDPGALAALQEAGQSPTDFLARHVRGNWGDVNEEDKRLNDEALVNGERILSAYEPARE